MKYLILFLFIAFSAPVLAADSETASAPAKCTSSTAGQLSCQANRMCECKHFNGSLMKGTPEGYRWDCGITRPNCLDFNKTEETKPYDGPSSVGDGINTQIEVNN